MWCTSEMIPIAADSDQIRSHLFAVEVRGRNHQMSESRQVAEGQDQDLREQRGGGQGVRIQHQLFFPADDSLPCRGAAAPSPGRDPLRGHWKHEKHRSEKEKDAA